MIPAGSTVNYVNMIYTFDFTFSDMQSGTREVTFGADAPGTTFDVSGILVTQGTRPVTGVISGTAADYPLLASPFTVSANWSAVTPPVTGVTILFKFEAEYSPVPEPGTLGLIAASLLGIGLLRRRYV